VSCVIVRPLHGHAPALESRRDPVSILDPLRGFIDWREGGREDGDLPDLALAWDGRRLARDGPNALTPPKTLPWYLQLALKFIDPFMVLLEVRYGGGGRQLRTITVLRPFVLDVLWLTR
jgi:hypothetical protein